MRNWRPSLASPISVEKSTGRSRLEKNSLSRASASPLGATSALTRKKLARLTRRHGPDLVLEDPGLRPQHERRQVDGQRNTEPGGNGNKGSGRRHAAHKKAEDQGNGNGRGDGRHDVDQNVEDPPRPKRAMAEAHPMTATAQQSVTNLASTRRARPSKGTIPATRHAAG
jgi:hypothetical protein